MPRLKNGKRVVHGRLRLHETWRTLSASVMTLTVIAKRDWRSLPNQVTLGRMVLAIPVIAFALLPGVLGWIGFACYVIAVSTDWVDGYLAKRNNGELMTEFGKILDPIADKVINLAALGILIARLERGEIWWLVVVATGVILVREVVVFWAKSRHPVMSASQAGRFAMTALVVAIGLLLMPVELPFELRFGAVAFGLGASCCAGWAYAMAPRSV